MDVNITSNIRGSPPMDCLLSKELRLKAKSSKRRNRRHIPHYQRPKEFVDKRNGRERQRVDDMNNAFETLKDRVPLITRRSVRTSKMNILTKTISYIQYLSTLVGELDESLEAETPSLQLSLDHVFLRKADPESAELIHQSETELLESRIPPILHECSSSRYRHRDLSPPETNQLEYNQSYQQSCYWNDSHQFESTLQEGSVKPSNLPALLEACGYQGELLMDPHRDHTNRNPSQTNFGNSHVKYDNEINGELSFMNENSHEEINGQLIFMNENSHEEINGELSFVNENSHGEIIGESTFLNENAHQNQAYCNKTSPFNFCRDQSNNPCYFQTGSINHL